MPGVRRLAARRDKAEPAIVQALEQVGAHCFRIDEPADLLVLFRRQWHVLEVKSPGGTLTRKQKENREKISAAGDRLPVVEDPHEALVAIGAICE